MRVSRPTKALYQRDETLRVLSTLVTAVSPAASSSEAEKALFKQMQPEDYIVETEETIFYAQGGGQPFDTGKMEKKTSADKDGEETGIFQVTAVRHADEGRILHLGRFLSQSNPGTFSVGESITQKIDGDRRALNSRVHTGGHLVGLAVRHLSSAISGVTELKAQHYPGAAFVEFRGLIDGKHKSAIQTKVDEFVSRDLPVKVWWWDEDTLRERCMVVPEAMKVATDGLNRAVDIEGAGAYPCGGTHVPSTALVGAVQVHRISRQKGVSKISYTIE